MSPGPHCVAIVITTGTGNINSVVVFRVFSELIYKLVVKFLKSIHSSSRLLSAVIYLKVVWAQNHQTILSY